MKYISLIFLVALLTACSTMSVLKSGAEKKFGLYESFCKYAQIESEEVIVFTNLDKTTQSGFAHKKDKKPEENEAELTLAMLPYTEVVGLTGKLRKSEYTDETFFLTPECQILRYEPTNDSEDLLPKSKLDNLEQYVGQGFYWNDYVNDVNILDGPLSPDHWQKYQVPSINDACINPNTVEPSYCGLVFSALDSTATVKLRNLEGHEFIEKSLINPSWDKKTKSFIMAKRVYLGMTRDQVVAAWSRPDNVYVSVGSWGAHERWIYSKRDAYLNFEEEILTKIED